MLDNVFQVYNWKFMPLHQYLFVPPKMVAFHSSCLYTTRQSDEFHIFHVSSAKRKLSLKHLGEDLYTDSPIHLVAVSSGCFVPGQQITRRMLFLKQWTANWVRPGGATTGACLQLPLTGQKISIGLANQKCSLLMMVDSSWRESNHTVDRNVANQSMSVVYLHS